MSMKHSRYLNTMALAAGLVVLTGCSTINKVFDNKESVNYRTARTVSSLEVPPDLTNPQYDSTFEVNSGKVSASTINNSTPSPEPGSASGNVVHARAARVNVLPDSTTMQIKGSGGDRRLVVAAPAGGLWSKVESFWASQGAELKRNEPAVGVMETDWIQTRGHLPQGSIQKALGSILKNGIDSGIRERYTVRFEKLSANSTSVYMTHRGAELVVTGTGNKWEMRPRRTTAEAEMLNRLKAYLQGADSEVTVGAPDVNSITVSSDPVEKKSTSVESKASRAAGSGHERERVGKNIDSDGYGIGRSIVAAFSKPKKVQSTVDSGSERERTGRNIDSGGYGVGRRVVATAPKTKKVHPAADRGYEREKTGRNIDSDGYGVGKSVKPPSVKLTVSNVNTNGQPSLKISGSYDSVWDRTGVALKKMGFTIDGQDKGKGLYAVNWAGYSKEGKNLSEQLQQMFSFRKEILEEGAQQLVRVSRLGEGAVLHILDRNGSATNPDMAKKVLDRLRKEFSR